MNPLWIVLSAIGYFVLSGRVKYENDPTNPTEVKSQDYGNAQPSQQFRVVSGSYPRADWSNQPWNTYTPGIMRGDVSDTVGYDPLDQPSDWQITNDLTSIWNNLFNSFGGNDDKYRLESRDSLDVSRPEDNQYTDNIISRY